MKGKLLLFFFALPFFGVGVWMGYSIAGNINDARRMQDWAPVPATLTRAGYLSHAGDDSTTYEAFAKYTYIYNGEKYVGDRVAIGGGSDNLGDYQRDLGNRLSRAMARREQIVVYVNPASPSESVVDRSLRWGLLGFKSIFFFVFGGVGLGLLIFAFKLRGKKELTALQSRMQPWLANHDWQTATIRSGSKLMMWGAWGFAALWNLISAPLPFIVYPEFVEKGNTLALVGLLFPLVGLGLITWAVQCTREWNRFGRAPVTLDPFPGSIGGHVGGTIDVNLPYDSNARFAVTLTNVHSHVSGSGNDRSHKESAQWQDQQIAHTASGVKGTRLSFRFDVPADLDASDVEKDEDSYYLWRLNLKADLPGADFDRDYEIPVYATGEQSSQLSGFPIEQARSEQGKLDLDAVRERVNLTHDASGKSLYFPMGRNLLAGVLGTIVGGVFASVGWYLMTGDGHPFFGGTFFLAGLVAMLVSLYAALNSLEIVKQGGEIRTVRRILGIPVKRRRMRVSDFVRFEKKTASKTQSGSKHVIHYTVCAVDHRGQKLILGEGFSGAGQAKAAMEFFAGEFGLVRQKKETEPEPDFGDANFLAAE